MSIFSRTRDIVAANVADLLDGSPDPAKKIRMIILEMEEALVEVRASAARTIADQKETRLAVGRLGELAEGWTEKAELALVKGREDLARQALAEKQKALDLAGQMGEEAGAHQRTLDAYEEDISRLQAKLREARSRQTAIANRLETAENRYRLRELTNGERAEDAFARFESLEREADYAEGLAEAIGLSGPPSLEDQIDRLAADERIEAELEAMKKRTQGVTLRAVKGA